MDAGQREGFWSSDKLTGSQTVLDLRQMVGGFWSSDKLTGSQTVVRVHVRGDCFGAVTN